MKTVRLGTIPINLIGGIHSSAVDFAQLNLLRPTHIFVEATRDVLGLIRRNPNHSPMLRDLPSVIAYADSREIPVYAIDASISSITSRMFAGMSVSDKYILWKYVLKRKLALPVSSFLLRFSVNRSAPECIDSFVTRWAVPQSLLEKARQGKTWEDVCITVSEVNDREVSSFFSSSTHDPSAYVELCASTGIDRRLQSVIIDFRNKYMCNQIQRVVRSIPEEVSVCVAIVGKNHIDGMSEQLGIQSDWRDEIFPSKSSFIDQLLLSQLMKH